MNKYIFVFAFLFGVLVPCYNSEAEGRYIRFTNADGVGDQYKLENDVTIVIYRSDETDGVSEMVIGYEAGQLDIVGILHPDRNVAIAYEDGQLDGVVTYHPEEERIIKIEDGQLGDVETVTFLEGMGEVAIFYEDGALQQIGTLPPDELDIVYEDGRIVALELIDPFDRDKVLKGIYNIASGTPVCR